jgi:hypothetical protein
MCQIKLISESFVKTSKHRLVESYNNLIENNYKDKTSFWIADNAEKNR